MKNDGVFHELMLKWTFWDDFEIGYRCKRKKNLPNSRIFLTDTTLDRPIVLQSKIPKNRDCMLLEKAGTLQCNF